MKIYIGLPTDNHMTSDFVQSYAQLIAYTIRNYPDLEIIQDWRQGVRTDKNRNVIVDAFIRTDADVLLFLDTDMVYPKELIMEYLAADKDVIGGVYFRRTRPHYPVAANLVDGKFIGLDVTTLPENRPVKIDGIGTGGMFIKRGVFDKLLEKGDPWFKYGDNYHLPTKTDNQETHDYIFCKKVLDAGLEVWIHTGMKFGHISNHIVTEAEWYQDKEYHTRGFINLQEI